MEHWAGSSEKCKAKAVGEKGGHEALKAEGEILLREWDSETDCFLQIGAYTAGVPNERRRMVRHGAKDENRIQIRVKRLYTVLKKMAVVVSCCLWNIRKS